MAQDNWVKSALSNDSHVADLLLHLKAAQPKPTPPLGWGHRQLRSNKSNKEPTTTTRCSPTTPLSWTADSLSDGGADAYSATARSKGTFVNDATTATTCKISSRKRKTFPELKEEESYLLKERVDLEKELASLNVTLNEQRSRRDNLNKIKIDYQVQAPNRLLPISNDQVSLIFNQFYKAEGSTIAQPHSIFPRHTINNYQPQQHPKKENEDLVSQERGFVLPDLNMMPSEEEPF